MIITATAVISSRGTIRLVRKEARPKKDEILATLELEVPDRAFQPQSITIRGTVAITNAARSEPSTLDRPQTMKHPATANGQTAIDVSEWTAVRIRRLMALLDVDSETLARRVGVSLALVRGWERSAGAINLSDTARTKLAELEAETKGVTG